MCELSTELDLVSGWEGAGVTGNGGDHRGWSGPGSRSTVVSGLEWAGVTVNDHRVCVRKDVHQPLRSRRRLFESESLDRAARGGEWGRCGCV